MLLSAINFFAQKSILYVSQCFWLQLISLTRRVFLCIPMLLIVIDFFDQKSILYVSQCFWLQLISLPKRVFCMYPNAFDCRGDWHPHPHATPLHGHLRCGRFLHRHEGSPCWGHHHDKWVEAVIFPYFFSRGLVSHSQLWFCGYFIRS